MFKRFILSVFAASMAFLTFGAISPADAGVDIRVNLSSQTLTARAPDGTTRQWAISSGRTGYRTIRGTFRPTVMKPYHWSRKYGGHMPHAIFFKGGFAIHGTTDVARLGNPASHGCVRLHPSAARELYAMVKQHGPRTTRIAINGVAPDTGRTMVAERRSVKQKAQAARRAPPREPGIVIPAFGPSQLVPDNRVWYRLR